MDSLWETRCRVMEHHVSYDFTHCYYNTYIRAEGAWYLQQAVFEVEVTFGFP